MCWSFREGVLWLHGGMLCQQEGMSPIKEIKQDTALSRTDVVATERMSVL